MIPDSLLVKQQVIRSAPESIQRAAVVMEAYTWLETPYQHEAAVKKYGVDCGMILVRVFVDTGLVDPFSPARYPRDFMCHNVIEQYLQIVEACGAKELPPGSSPGPGDIAMWRYGKLFSHSAIVVNWPTRVIHAYSKAHRVIEDDASASAFLSDPSRPRKFYSIW